MSQNKVLLMLSWEYSPGQGAIVIHHPSMQGILTIPCSSQNEGLEKMYAAVEEANELIRQSMTNNNPVAEIAGSIADIKNSLAEIAAIVKK